MICHYWMSFITQLLFVCWPFTFIFHHQAMLHASIAIMAPLAPRLLIINRNSHLLATAINPVCVHPSPVLFPSLRLLIPSRTLPYPSSSPHDYILVSSMVIQHLPTFTRRSCPCYSHSHVCQCPSLLLHSSCSSSPSLVCLSHPCTHSSPLISSQALAQPSHHPNSFLLIPRLIHPLSSPPRFLSNFPIIQIYFFSSPGLYIVHPYPPCCCSSSSHMSVVVLVLSSSMLILYCCLTPAASCPAASFLAPIMPSHSVYAIMHSPNFIAPHHTSGTFLPSRELQQGPPPNHHPSRACQISFCFLLYIS